MYCEHFGLEILPFKITPDPAFLCPNSQNRRALSMLRSDLAQQCPINVVTGDVGTGKTTLILHALNDMPETITLGLLSNFPGWADDILPWVLYTFEVPDAPDDAARLEAFEAFVKKEHSAGRKCVLIVDEAQNVSEAGLEQLRKLVNLNTGAEIRFMVVLVGQSELQGILKNAQCGAIAQRIGVSVTIDPMTAVETDDYIRHRLMVAGGKRDIFDHEAIAAVHRISGGYPRLVNVVCDSAMVLAYGGGDHVIGKDIIGCLGEKDGALSHLPDIVTNARAEAGAESGPKATAAIGAGTSGIETPLHGHDVFDFMSTRLRAEREGEIDRVPATPTGIMNSRADCTRPRTSPAAPSKAPEAKRQRRQASGAAAASARKPVKRIGLHRVLGGTVTGGLVAACLFFLAPLPLQESPLKEPPEIVSIQSAAALAPVALKRVEMELPEKPVPLTDMSGEAFLDRALSAGMTDPTAAAIDYARAALRGEHLAAYYLGQLYETGDGVTHDLARARSWYASVEQSVRGARRRLEDLGAPLRTGELSAPRLLLGGVLDTGGAEFVWTSGDGADAAFFVVELSEGPASTLRRLPPQETSALKVDDIGDARFWRVLAVAPDMQRYSASEWWAMGASEAVMTSTDGVLPEALVRLSGDTAPERLTAVTKVLTASQIPYRIEKPGAGAGEATELQIGYFFEGDEKAARKVADAVGARSANMMAETTGPDRPMPTPGQIIILAAGR